MKGKKDEQRHFALSFHVRNNEVSFSRGKKKKKKDYLYNKGLKIMSMHCNVNHYMWELCMWIP